MKTEARQVTMRDLRESDIPAFLEYWYSQPTFVESMGVDLKKLPAKADREIQLKKMCQKNQNERDSKMTILTILFENQPIGSHTINELKIGESAIFHAHIWRP